MPTKKKVEQPVNKNDETVKAAKAPAKKKAPAVKPAPEINAKSAPEGPAEVKANIKENAAVMQIRNAQNNIAIL